MYSNSDNEITIYKGKGFSHNNNYKKVPIVIAFDLDETLGTFSDLEILWRSIPNKLKLQENFNKLLDLYPEFIRYGIIPILEFLYHKKKKGICDKIYIYTNNQCSQEWCKFIAKYFDYKLKTETELFDQIICAFKINNKIVEMKRTTHNKTYKDFIKCTLLPPKTKICFIDNSYFFEMKNDHVYYIQPMSYFHNISPTIIIDRFINSTLFEKSTTNVLLYNNFLQFGQNNSNLLTGNLKSLVDIQVAQKMMYHVREFFYLTQKKMRTKKIRYPSGRFTRKKTR